MSADRVKTDIPVPAADGTGTDEPKILGLNVT